MNMLSSSRAASFLSTTQPPSGNFIRSVSKSQTPERSALTSIALIMLAHHHVLQSRCGTCDTTGQALQSINPRLCPALKRRQITRLDQKAPIRNFTKKNVTHLSSHSLDPVAAHIIGREPVLNSTELGCHRGVAL